MEYNKTTLEGRRNFSLIRQLEKTKNQITNINYDQNSMTILKKHHNKNNFAPT